MELAHIKNRIHVVRGMKIMLDFDLAQLYTIETKRLKEAVRRNIRRFPEDFMFELTSNEWENLRTQIASSSWGGKRYTFLLRLLNRESPCYQVYFIRMSRLK